MKRTHAIILAAICTATFLVFANTLSFDLLNWDDDKLITKNPLIKSPTSENLKKLYAADDHIFLTQLMFAVEYKIYGLNPSGYHLLNIILHILNTILAFLFIRTLSKNPIIALTAAALFALHPLRVESVAWVAERKDLLYTFFYLSGMLLYIRYLRKESLLIFLGVILLFYLSSLSKIQAVAFPVSLLLLDIYYKRKFNILFVYEKFLLFYLFFAFLLFDESWRNYANLLSILAVLSIIYYTHKNFITLPLRSRVLVIASIPLLYAFRLAPPYLLLFSLWYIMLEIMHRKGIRFSDIKFLKINYLYLIALGVALLLPIVSFLLIQKPFDYWNQDVDSNLMFSFFDRIFLAAYAFCFYIYKCIIPFNLSAVHPYPEKISGLLPAIYYYSGIIAMLVISLLFFIHYKLKKLSSLMIFGLMFFLIHIALVLHIIPIEGRLVVADRYTYLAYLGLFLVVAIGFAKLWTYFQQKSILIPVGLFSLTFLLMAFQSHQRTYVWENDIRLFSDVIEKKPGIAFAHVNRGGAYVNLKLYEEALDDLNIGIELDSGFTMAYYNRGQLYYAISQFENAILDFNTILRLTKNNRDSAISLNDRGMSYLQLGLADQAIADLEQSISIDTLYPNAYNNRGWYHYLKGNISAAFHDFNKAIQLNPDMVEAYLNRGLTYLLENNQHKAIADFSEAIKRNSTDPRPYINRAYVYTQQSRFDAAIKDLNTAIMNDSSYTEAYRSLGYIYFSKGNLQKSLDLYSKAIELEPTQIGSLLNRGWIYRNLGQNKLAFNDFSRIIELDSTHIDAYLFAGWTQAKLTNITDAMIFFNKALLLDNATGKPYYYMALAYEETNNTQAAISNYTQAIERRFMLNETRNARAKQLFLLGRKLEACSDWAEAATSGHTEAIEKLREHCGK